MSHHEPDSHTPGDTPLDAHDAHAAEALGPLDWRAWGMAVLGGVLALLVAISLLIAAHP